MPATGTVITPPSPTQAAATPATAPATGTNAGTGGEASQQTAPASTTTQAPAPKVSTSTWTPTLDFGAIAKDKLKNLAAKTSGYANTFMADYMAGKLPPGQSNILKLAQQQITAQIKATYASMGLSGSTMESQALAQGELQVAAEQASMVQQNFQNAVEMYGVDLNALGRTTTISMNDSQVAAQDQAATSEAAGSIAAAIGMYMMA